MLMEEIDYAQYMLCSSVINPCNPHLEVLNPAERGDYPLYRRENRQEIKRIEKLQAESLVS